LLNDAVEVHGKALKLFFGWFLGNWRDGLGEGLACWTCCDVDAFFRNFALLAFFRGGRAGSFGGLQRFSVFFVGLGGWVTVGMLIDRDSVEAVAKHDLVT
jgi:hypothetical protein